MRKLSEVRPDGIQKRGMTHWACPPGNDIDRGQRELRKGGVRWGDSKLSDIRIVSDAEESADGIS